MRPPRPGGGEGVVAPRGTLLAHTSEGDTRFGGEHMRILSSELAAHADGTVEIAGWVHRRRLLKSVAFLIIRDRAGLAQVVAAPALVAPFGEETVVRVRGAARSNTAAPGGVEIVDPAIEPLTDPAEPPPFDLYRPELSAAL